jgi:hypothetical protein
MRRIFPIIFTDDVFRTDDYVDINTSVNVNVNFSSNNYFFV